MPFVRSYFRRSPGAAGVGDSRQDALPALDVAIYGADGTSLLRDLYGARYRYADLQFGTTLPGGYSECRFVLRSPAPRVWPVAVGQKVIVRLGRQIVWWGWIEDVRRRQQGRTTDVGVTCLGPWQQVCQRHIDVAYTSAIAGDAALADCLRTYCNEISTDYSQLEATGVDISSLTISKKHLSELVALVCAAGGATGLPLQFAIWAPTERATNGYPTSIATNSNMETGSPGSWTFAQVTGDPAGTWVVDHFNSADHAIQISRGVAGGTQVGRWSQSNLSCAASTSYTFDYWLYWPAKTNGQAYLQIVWYDSGGGYLTTDATTVINSTGTAGGARYVETITSPAGAHHFTVRCVASLGAVAGLYATFDDVYVYATGAAVEVDNRPRAELWTPTGYDYLLYTALVALDVTTSSREIANAVVASYGATPSYTAYAQDADSQAAYRRRDLLVATGKETGATVAAAVRDAALAAYAAPTVAPAVFRAQPGAIRTAHGASVPLPSVRAGDRLLIADGQHARDVVMLRSTMWSAEGLQCTPAGVEDVGRLLA